MKNAVSNEIQADEICQNVGDAEIEKNMQKIDVFVIKSKFPCFALKNFDLLDILLFVSIFDLILPLFGPSRKVKYGQSFQNC